VDEIVELASNSAAAVTHAESPESGVFIGPHTGCVERKNGEHHVFEPEAVEGIIKSESSRVGAQSASPVIRVADADAETRPGVTIVDVIQPAQADRSQGVHLIDREPDRSRVNAALVVSTGFVVERDWPGEPDRLARRLIVAPLVVERDQLPSKWPQTDPLSADVDDRCCVIRHEPCPAFLVIELPWGSPIALYIALNSLR
jgi:hypothetical protein